MYETLFMTKCRYSILKLLRGQGAEIVTVEIGG